MILTAIVILLSLVSLWLSLQGLRISRAGEDKVSMRLLKLALVMAGVAFLLAVLGLVLALTGRAAVKPWTLIGGWSPTHTLEKARGASQRAVAALPAPPLPLCRELPPGSWRMGAAESRCAARGLRSAMVTHWHPWGGQWCEPAGPDGPSGLGSC